MEMMTQGRVYTVSCFLDLITEPTKIPYKPSLAIMGARIMPVGGIGEQSKCYKAKRWGAGKSGNVNNARWRRLQNRRKSTRNSGGK